MRDLYQIFCANFLCMLPMAVAQSSFVMVMKSQGEGVAVLGVFFPIVNAL